MLALSTSFGSQTIADGVELLKSIADFGVSAIELDCRVTRLQHQQIKSAVRRMLLQVVSLHNYCPFPALKPNQAPGGDYFLLSSADRTERDLAVQWTTRTIQNADDLEARFVVLHCGAVEMDPDHRRLYALYHANPEQPEAWQSVMSRELDRRRDQHMAHMDALRFSLDRLLNSALKYEITLGLENRSHYFEMPDSDEFSALFEEFAGAPMGFWLDTGHAHQQERLGVISQEKLIETHADHLVGIHLHDALGLQDHLAPGNGEIDFDLLSPHLKNEPEIVIELAPGSDDDSVRQAISFARSLTGDVA